MIPEKLLESAFVRPGTMLAAIIPDQEVGLDDRLSLSLGASVPAAGACQQQISAWAHGAADVLPGGARSALGSDPPRTRILRKIR